MSAEGVVVEDSASGLEFGEERDARERVLAPAFVLARASADRGDARLPLSRLLCAGVARVPLPSCGSARRLQLSAFPANAGSVIERDLGRVSAAEECALYALWGTFVVRGEMLVVERRQVLLKWACGPSDIASGASRPPVLHRLAEEEHDRGSLTLPLICYAAARGGGVGA